MSQDSPSNPEEREQRWIEEYLDGRIAPADFAQMQGRLAADATFRAEFRRFAALDSHLFESVSREVEEIGDNAWNRAASPAADERFPAGETPTASPIPFPGRILPLAAAAGLAFLLGLGLMQMRDSAPGPGDSTDAPETSASGFAVIEQLSDPVWPDGAVKRSEGDLIAAETFRLDSGAAEIQFFSGASMIVAGPAEIALRSAWEAECREGSVRMRVPPAARGFRLHGPETEIVDLGTEFGLEVRNGQGRVEVFDGEIAMRHRGGEERLVGGGAAYDLPAAGGEHSAEPGAGNYPDPLALEARSKADRAADYSRWTSHRDRLAADPDLIAYYTFERERTLVADLAHRVGPLAGEHDGAVVLAREVAGRWPGLKPALEFRRPGSRVRVNIPGEFSAFTFACWVRIDSLDRHYNALFLGDGYETGEPHWQIRDDGKMMLSVMVDDSRPSPYAPDDAGFHRVYFSEPMWDISKSGQWIHLVSVFDPANRRVSHYVDGERISRQRIEDRFFIDTLRVGNAEIGNWGQPFREDPAFAIRNLNGRIGELAIFRTALDDGAVASLHDASRVSR